MNEEKAKFILNAGTPREIDADQEAVQQALRVAEGNTEVGEWMTRQQKATDAIHHKLNELPVPPGLKDRILAGEAVSRPRTFWLNRSVLAMAAAFVVLFGIVFWQLAPQTLEDQGSFASLRADMGAFLSGPFSLELHSKHLDKLQSHLADQHQFTNYEIPEALAQNASVGCRTIEWQETEVALICFSVHGELVHFMVLPKDELPSGVEELNPVQQGEWATTGWQDELNVYLVATRGDAVFLQDVLEGKYEATPL